MGDVIGLNDGGAGLEERFLGTKWKYIVFCVVA